MAAEASELLDVHVPAKLDPIRVAALKPVITGSPLLGSHTSANGNSANNRNVAPMYGFALGARLADADQDAGRKRNAQLAGGAVEGVPLLADLAAVLGRADRVA